MCLIRPLHFYRALPRNDKSNMAAVRRGIDILHSGCPIADEFSSIADFTPFL
jgi:hypothetical protein